MLTPTLGVQLYGKDWRQMQPMIKSRTITQIRTHAQKVLKKFTLEQLMQSGQSSMQSAAESNVDALSECSEGEKDMTNIESSLAAETIVDGVNAPQDPSVMST